MTKVPEEVNRKQTIINQAKVKVEFKSISLARVYKTQKDQAQRNRICYYPILFC
jgi:hypothetical protein